MNPKVSSGDFQFFDTIYKKPVLIPAIIIISSVAILILNVYGLRQGITYVFPHLFYLPIILTAYYYPRRGVPVAAFLSLCYYAVVLVAITPTLTELISAFARSIVFIIIAAVVSHLSGRMHHDTQMCRRLVSVVRSSGDAIIGETIDGTITDWNSGAEQLYGFTSQEMIGTSIFGLIPAERQEEKHLLLDKIRRGESVERVETERIRKDGTRVQISLASSPIRNRDEEVVGISEIAHDITERKRAEERVRESEERFRVIFASQENGIFIIDPSDHRIVDVNPYLCDLVGLPKEQITGKVCHTFVCPAEVGKCPITDLGQTVDAAERVLIAADGSKIPIIKTVVRIRIDKKDYLIENINDISERKAAEEAVRVANEQLEERVRQRTAELETTTRGLEEEVKQRRAAEEVVRNQLAEKTLLLREVHHRVKNNLQIITSLLSLQSRKIRDASLQMALSESQNRIRSMSYVHEKLYTSGDLGRVALDGYVRFLAGNLFTLYDVPMERIGLEVETHQVAVDINTAIPLGLVLNELISNSIRHAFAPGVIGAIRITADEDEEGSLHIVVWDNGRGVPQGFDPENSDTLGLKLAYGLVGQLDGTITSQTKGGQQYTIDIIRKKGVKSGPGTYNPVPS